MEHLQDYEVGASHLENFLYNTNDVHMDDGTVALSGVQKQLWIPRQHQGSSLDFIEQEGHDLNNGLMNIYSARHNSNRLHTIGQVLAGSYAIASLTPDVAMPGVIAVEQKESSALSLWIWRQPWRASGITEDQTQLLAAAAQLEAPGVGEHQAGRSQTAGEAQHLLSMLSIVDDPRMVQNWSAGTHINHSPTFRAKGTLPSVAPKLLGQHHHVSLLRIRQNEQHTTEVSIDGSPYQLAPQTRLLWHRDSMQASTAQGVKVCNSPKALAIVQGAGFMAVRHEIGAIERVIRGNAAY